MEPHIWGRSTQTLEVRVCIAHGIHDPMDPNVTCEGLEIRINRASAAGSWVGETTEPSPEAVLVIRRTRSRGKEPEGPYADSPGVETVPFGPALRLQAEDGFELLRALKRALEQASQQGLVSRRDYAALEEAWTKENNAAYEEAREEIEALAAREEELISDDPQAEEKK